MKELTEYFALQNKIYEYFGYVEDWVVIPIDDRREYLWRLSGVEKNDFVTYWKSDEKLELGEYYQDDIYTQRFLQPQGWVYFGKEYTMICVDTHTDGNKFLAIYDNAKRREGSPT